MSALGQLRTPGLHVGHVSSAHESRPARAVRDYLGPKADIQFADRVGGYAPL
jgi:hypothetical protein